MDDQSKRSLTASPEQLLYARILEKGMMIGLLTLLVTFAIYAFGILDSYIALDKISQYWTLNVHTYLEHAKLESGWAWLGLLGYGDFLNFIGVAILAGVTIISYLAIVPMLLKNKDIIYAVLALLEVIILSLAASGIIAGGH